MALFKLLVFNDMQGIFFTASTSDKYLIRHHIAFIALFMMQSLHCALLTRPPSAFSSADLSPDSATPFRALVAMAFVVQRAEEIVAPAHEQWPQGGLSA